ncbi:helix-turn-helix domain-containing protein [Gynuella sp.]|uniref:helix-turn-helix domain-containing protein n=1 Tax=Gynuella sp. TaxID=2969146 RepID=UPI003D0CD1F6
MAQTIALIDTIKRNLKQRKITYADLAVRLNLSEANIKRMFSKRDFTLQRLDGICQVLQMDFTDLIQEMQYGSSELEELSIEMETELVSDPYLILLTLLVISQWEFQDILDTYKWTLPELTKLMAKLDRMRILDLLPGNKYRLLLSRHFKWQKRGPVHKFFAEKVQQEFFSTQFDTKKGELLLVVNGMLSRSSNKQIQRSIQRLAKEFDELSKEDAKLPQSEIFGTSVVLAIRPWELKEFTDFRVKPLDKKF